MNKLLSIKEASKLLGVSESTLRRWEKEKKLIPDERTKGNQRRYRLSSIRPEMMHGQKIERKTIEVEVLIINKGEDSSFEEDLAKDVLEIITVFSARLYGARSRKNQKLIDKMKEAVDDNTQD